MKSDRGESSNSKDDSRRIATLFLAIGAGFSIANCYALQPVLPQIATSLGEPLALVGLVAGALQLGYMMGIVLLVPLGDRISSSIQISVQYLLLGAALLGAAASQTLPTMIACALLIGAMASNAVNLSALAFRSSRDCEKGKSVGIVASGISAGILLSRYVGGSVAQLTDWRTLLALLSVCAFGSSWFAWKSIPKLWPTNTAAYGKSLRSLPKLLLQHRLLREGAFVGACWFFVFSAIWIALMLMVTAPPMNWSTSNAGMLGLAGAAGIFATATAGRLTDRLGPRYIILGGLLFVLAGLMAIVLWTSSPAGLVIGVVLFDVGCFAAQVANQTRLLAIDPKSRSSIYSVYMLVYYLSGAVGSSVAPWILSNAGWNALICLCLTVIATAIASTVWAHQIPEATS